MTRRAVFSQAAPDGYFLDESDREGLTQYLHAQAWIDSSDVVRALASAGEGNMNCTLRVTTRERTFILKQSRPWVEKYPEIPAIASQARPVWIDTDPSIRPGGHEVDDGLALIQAFHSPELSIRGVSLVFGNAPLDIEIPIGREIVDRYGPVGLKVSVGAAGREELGAVTEASLALANALRAEPLTILALGPGTNVGTVLLEHPELADRIVEVVAVAGRRPGQSFVTGGRTDTPHCDCNFDKDTESFRVILEAGVPLTLAPWEISSKVWLREPELDRLERGGAGAQHLVASARDWLALWSERYGVDGFNPFDTLAVGYLTTSETIVCDTLPVEIVEGPDDRAVAAGQDPLPSKPYLVVNVESDSPYRTTYCHTPTAEFTDDLMERLLAASS